MKRFTCCLPLLFSLSAIVHAQTDQGDWMMGGALSLNTAKKSTEFTLTPNVGYFFGRNFAAGAEMIIKFSKLGDIRHSELGVGPFARYYFELKEPVFKPYIHGAFKLSSVRTKTEGVSETETGTGFIIGLGGAYFINDNVAIDGLAGYNHTKVEDEHSYGGFIFRIGFQVHLLRREVTGN